MAQIALRSPSHRALNGRCGKVAVFVQGCGCVYIEQAVQDKNRVSIKY